MPQTWTSDDSDAIERLKIQYGTSIVYPVSTMGAHVSAVPNHQVGRVTSLETRGNVVFIGKMGTYHTKTFSNGMLLRTMMGFFHSHGLWNMARVVQLINSRNTEFTVDREVLNVQI